MNTITGKVEITVEEFERLRDIERNQTKVHVFTRWTGVTIASKFENESDVMKMLNDAYKKDIEVSRQGADKQLKQLEEQLKQSECKLSECKKELQENIEEFRRSYSEWRDENIKLKQSKSIFFWRNK